MGRPLNSGVIPRRLSIDRGDRVLIEQVLSAAFFQENGEAVVGLDIGLHALPVDQKERQEMVFPDRLIEEFLLYVRPAWRRISRCLIRSRRCMMRRRDRKDGVRRGDIGDFLFQKGDDLPVFFEVDLIPADVMNDAVMLGLVHLPDTDLDTACLDLGKELRFDGLP
jgi:hypothetical protein